MCCLQPKTSTTSKSACLSTPDGERVLVWYGRAKPGMPTLLYFHGNAGSLADRAERIRKYMAKGYGMFMMTYRGFGGSTGAAVGARQRRRRESGLRRRWSRAASVRRTSSSMASRSGLNVAVQVAAKQRAAGPHSRCALHIDGRSRAVHYPQIPLQMAHDRSL